MAISAQLAQARFDYFNAPASAGATPESLGNLAPAEAEKSLSFSDVLDALNPLNHLPFVSALSVAPGDDNKPAPLTRAVGVAASVLLGGPVGLIASVAGMVFESETGQTPVQALANAVLDTPPAPTEHAAATTAATQEEPLVLAALTQPAELPTPSTAAVPPAQDKRRAVLELYGASGTSAHASYRQAQLRPYLQDVTVSKVL